MSRIRQFFTRGRREAELAEEIQSHLEEKVDELVAGGVPREQAIRQARREFGNVTLLVEQGRDVWSRRWIENFFSDVRFAVRQLRRTPAFTFAAVSTLTLGIGAATAIFSVANAALLKPLPYPHWEDIRTVRTTFTDGRVTTGLVAPLEFSRLDDPGLPIVRSAMTLRLDAALMGADNTPTPLVAHGVSNGFFELVGLPLAIGPGFTPEYFRGRGPTGAVISHRLWREVFGSDPSIVGRPLRLTTGDVPVVGVAGAAMDLPSGADVWINLTLAPDSTSHAFDGYLRVRPGTNAELLGSRLQAVAERLGREYPGPEGNRAFVVRPLVHTIVGDLRPILLIVLSATGLLLLLACVNVTNLLLARAATRGHEMALRSALGAHRGRLVRQLLTESLVLASIGSAAGAALAYAAVQASLAFGASKLPRLETVAFDWAVLGFVVTLLFVSALTVGVAPAISLARRGLEGMLRDSGRAIAGSGSARRPMRMLIIAEIAVAVTLVAGAGWLVRSFINLQESDPGFSAKGRLTFDLTLPFDRYRDSAFRAAWVQALLSDLRHMSGVVASGTGTNVPLRPEIANTTLIMMDGWTDAHVHVVARQFVISTGYFDAMGIPLRRGRGFSDDDRAGTAPVAIVNESFVRKYLDGRDPLVTQMAFGFPQPSLRTRRPIVGVVSDVKYASLWSEPEPAFYLPQDQSWESGQTLRQSVVVATDVSNPAS